MSRNAIIGSNGFIGSALKRYADKLVEEEWVGITRENYSQWRGKDFSTMIWCAGVASKRASREDLIKDHIYGLSLALRDFSYNKFVYISSQAVYEDSAKFMTANEDLVVRPEKLSDYAWVKYTGEKIVRMNTNDWLILRPNGFTGPGLRKNVVFDLMSNPPQLFVSPFSEIQYMHIDKFAELILGSNLLKKSCKKLNITAHDEINPRQIAEILGVSMDTVQIKDNAPRFSANMSVTKIEQLLNIQMPSCREAVLNWNRPLY